MKIINVIVVVVVMVAIGAYIYIRQPFTDQPYTPVDLDLPPEVSIEEPGILYPAPQPQIISEQTEPLPVLDKSDELMQKKLASLTAPLAFGEMFVFDDLIRRIVVTLDNMTQDQLPFKYRPSEPPSGPFIVRAESEEIALVDPKNYQRYRQYVQIVETIKSEQLVELYAHVYPLFQEAYEELGYPSNHFNDRLIAIIDHLLDTPEVEGPVRLVRPHVLYQFADPELEELTAGQKILIRIGSDNAARIKAKLGELRQALTDNLKIN